MMDRISMDVTDGQTVTNVSDMSVTHVHWSKKIKKAHFHFFVLDTVRVPLYAKKKRTVILLL